MKLNNGILIYLIKMLTFLSIILRISYLKIKIKKKNTDFNDNYTKLNLNLTFHNINKRKNRINITIYAFSINNGGRSRITALLEIYNSFAIYNSLILKDYKLFI